MIHNTLGDLNNYLFATLERLDDEELKGEQLEEEIKRAKAITNVASQIIGNGNLALKARAMQEETGNKEPLPPMLEAKK